MGDLILYLGITCVGYFVGSRVRKKGCSISWTGRVQMIALICLVLMMGMRMGANKEITENISSIGLIALFMTIVIMGMSILAIFIARRAMGIDKYGRLKAGIQENIKPDESLEEEIEKIQEEEEKGGTWNMTVAIVVSVALGMILGYFPVRHFFAQNMDVFANAAGIGIKVGLCLLLAFVGLDLGIEGTVVDNFKKVGFRILVFPLAVVVGTLVGAGIFTLFTDLSLKECLAIGAGFGWYTLAPGIILENGYVTAGAISFLHNVLRELFAILFIPIVAKKIGYIETTGMPGAAAMDVCLPIVEKSTRSDIAVYSFVSGVVLSILVPVLVQPIIG